MNKILSAIRTAFAWVGFDGVLHFGISFAVVVLLGWCMPVWIAVAIIAALGLGKELYDLVKVGAKQYDWKHSAHDLICDAAGIVLGVLLCVLYIYTRR